ncbi:MAG: AsnC family transcriptional regulator [Candidatus Baldrarchaeia archaeon]
MEKENLYSKYHKRLSSSASRSAVFDDVDRKIIRCLLKNPRTTLREIAKDVGVTRTTVRNRLKKLFENKCITTKVLFNIGTCNFRFAFLGLNFSEFRDFNRCLQIAMYCPRVIILIKNINRYHVVLVLIAEDDKELYRIIDEFQFLEGVKNSYIETFATVNLLKPVFIEFVPFFMLDPDEIRNVCNNCPLNLYIGEK